MYSTISIAYRVFIRTETNCQGVGICINGSFLLSMQYSDPLFCDYQNNCPRFYVTSSSTDSNGYMITTYSGTLHAAHPPYMLGTYQRPALAHF